MRKLRSLLLIASVVLSTAVLAGAATFIVDNTVDAVDAKPGDGKCATAEGSCSLRAAVQEANALGKGDDVIDLLAGTYVLQLAPAGGMPSAAHGDLDIFGPLTINGAGAATTIVDGGGIDRVFSAQQASTVAISDVTVRNGKALAGQNGGGIWSDGALTLEDVVVTNNRTLSGGTLSANAAGGGIYSTNSLHIRSSVISGNAAADAGGGIFSKATLTVAETEIAGNSSLTDKGGGIANWGQASIILSTITGNKAAASGGGVDNVGHIVLTHSTVTGNEAQSGGGIRNVGHLTGTDLTLSGNTAYATGGGIQNENQKQGQCAASLNNVTIAGNRAGRDAGGAPAGGGIFNANGAQLQLSNTIVAANVAVDGKAPDCAGALTSAAHNLIQDVSGCTITGNTTGDITGKDALLGPLADNGGLTKTRALLPGSPAIDAGSSAKPGSGGGACEVSDERGVPRPVKDGKAMCDIGAFEYRAERRD